MAPLLLISSAFLHALWNALAKKSGSPSSQVMGILIFATLFATAFVPFFSGAHFPTLLSFWWAIGAGIFEAGYVAALAITFDKAALGLSYTLMRGGAMLLVWAFSTVFLGEKLTSLALAGVTLVVGGLYLTGRVSRRSKPRKGGELYAYLCAFFIAAYHLCYGQSLALGANPASLFALSLWVAVPALLIINGKEKFLILKERMWNSPLPFVTGGLICALSFMLFLLGLRHAGAGYALTLRNTSVIFAQIFAATIGERVSLIQWLGAVLVAVGVSFVTSNG